MNNVELGRKFRDAYVAALRRLLVKGKLQLGGKVDFLKDSKKRESWLDELAAVNWNVFIQGPPHGKSDPQQVIKYLAGYLTGGPINDRRLIEFNEEEVTFWARPKHNNKPKRRGMNPPQPYRLTARQFMQRWALHILPKGFTKSRCYGGYHGSKRTAYLCRSRERLRIEQHAHDLETIDAIDDPQTKPARKCPSCESDLLLIHSERRPSWRDIFARHIHIQPIYSPMHHINNAHADPPRPWP